MPQQDRPRIVVAEGINESALERLQNAGEVVRLPQCDDATLRAEVVRADALLVRTYARVTADVIAEAKAAGRLKVIGRAGVGVDNIDVRAACDAGIPVVHTPAACTYAVAELAVGLMVSVHRRICELDRRLRQGAFAELRSESLRPELQHLTLGIIGMGRIGQAVSRRMHWGMGMRVVYYDIREIGYLPFAASALESAEAVYRQADMVSLHVPLTRRTRGMINTQALRHFKPGAYLINTSRGPVVEAGPLAEALREGGLAGAAIDVFDPEPPPPDHPLLHAPRCLLTPHIGARSQEGLAAMNDVVDDVIAVLEGKKPTYQALPEPDGG